jgi:hypothetical protein
MPEGRIHPAHQATNTTMNKLTDSATRSASAQAMALGSRWPVSSRLRSMKNPAAPREPRTATSIRTISGFMRNDCVTGTRLARLRAATAALMP